MCKFILIIFSLWLAACGNEQSTAEPNLDTVPHTMLFKTDFNFEQTFALTSDVQGSSTASAYYDNGALVLNGFQDIQCPSAEAAWITPFPLPAPGKKFYVGIVYSSGVTDTTYVNLTVTINGLSLALKDSADRKMIRLIEIPPAVSGQLDTFKFLLSPCGPNYYLNGTLKIYQVAVYQD